MPIAELDLILDRLKGDDFFLKSDPITREQIINANVSAYIGQNPSVNSDKAIESGRQFNQNIRRDLGEGRKQVDGSVALAQLQSRLPENYESLGESEKIEKLQDLKNITGEIAIQDPINSEDIKFQLDSIIDETERVIRGADTGFAGDKFYRAFDGLINSFVGPWDAEEAKRLNRELFPENPNMDSSFLSKLAFGAGDFAGQTAAFIATSALATPAVATGALFGANASRRFQDNYATAQALGLDEDQAVQAGLASLPGSVIDSLGDRLIVGRFLPSDTTKKLRNTLRNTPSDQKFKVLADALKEGVSSGVMKRALRDAFAEGASEAAGDFIGGYGGYLATGYEQFIPSSSELRDSFAIGAILGGGASLIATPFRGEGALNALEQNADQLEQLKEESRQKFVAEFQAGNTAGALQVLQDFQKQTKQRETQERNQANVDARRQRIQEIQAGGQQSGQNDQSPAQQRTPSDQGVAEGATSPSLLGGAQEGGTTPGDGQVQPTQSVTTNTLARAIAGDEIAEEELSGSLPQRVAFRDKITGTGIDNAEDAFRLMDVAVAKAVQASGLDPATAYQNLTNIQFVKSDQAAQQAREAGKQYILLKKNADFDTLTEELSHVMRQSGILSRAIGPTLNANLEREFGVQNGEWNRDQEDRFADEFINYLRSGRARNSVLQDVFDRVKQIFRSIYENILIALEPTTATERRAVRRQNQYVSPAAIEAIMELFNIGVDGIQADAQFVNDILQLQQANPQALTDLEERVRQAQAQALQREGIGDIVQNLERNIDLLNAERAITEAADAEIEAWYRQQALELGVSRTVNRRKMINAKQRLADLGVDIAIPQPTGTEAFNQISREADVSADVAQQQEERQQSERDRISLLRGIQDRAGQSAENIRQTGVAQRLQQDLEQNFEAAAQAVQREEEQTQKVLGPGATLQQEGFGEVGNIGDINAPVTNTLANQPAQPAPQPTQAIPQPVSQQIPNIRSQLRFIHDRLGKFENNEDKELASLLNYLGKAIPNILQANLNIEVDRIVKMITDFDASRNRRRRTVQQRPLTTREEIREAQILTSTFQQQFAEHLLNKFEPILGSFDGDRNNPDAADFLNKVKAWLLQNGALEEGAKRQGSAPASEEQIAEVNSVVDQLLIKHPNPNSFLSDYEYFEGEIDNEFGLRDSIVNLLSNTFNHLATMELEGMTRSDAVSNLLLADALLNTQSIATIGRIGNANYRNNVTEGAREREGTWRGKVYGNISRFFGKPIDRVDMQNSMVSNFTETQRFFQNEVFGEFDEAVFRMSNHYRVMLDRYLDARNAHRKRLGFKEDDQRIAGEDVHLGIALLAPQAEIGKDFNEQARKMFAKLRKTVENQRKTDDRRDIEVANQIEKAIDRLESFVDLDSPSLYADVRDAIPAFLNYDNAGEDAVNSRMEYLDKIRSIFADMRPALKFITESHREAFQDFVDYAPTSAIEIDPSVGQSDLETNFIGGDADMRAFKSGKKQVSEVKRRTDLGDKRYYDFNMDRTIPRQILGVLFETYTTPQRFDLAKLYDAKSEFAQIVTGGNPKSLNDLKSTVILMSENTLRRAQVSPPIVRAMNDIKGQLVKIHLGSVGKIVVEPAASLSHFFARRLGKKGYNTMENFTQALKIMGTRWGEYSQFVQRYNRDLWERSLSGEVETDTREMSKLNRAIPGWLKKFDKASGDILLWPLRMGDGFAAHTIFMTEYLRLLKETGQARKDGTGVDFSKPDFKLMNEAMRFTEEHVGLSGRERRGFFFSDRDPKLAVIRGLLFSYSHHLSQLGQQLQRDVRGISWHLRSRRPDLAKDQLRNAAGIMGQIAVFSAFRFGTMAMMTIFMSNLIKDLFDDEEGTLARLQKNVDEALTDEEKQFAQQEYEQAKIVRDHMNKWQKQTMSRESLFKSLLRDEISGVHILLNAGNSFIPRVIAMPIDRAAREAHNEAVEENVRAMKEEMRQLRKIGQLDEARRLQEQIQNLSDNEYIPIFYDVPSESGIPGIYGSVLDTLAAPAQDLTEYIAQVSTGRNMEPFGWKDMFLHLQALGIGQSDLNRFVRKINKIEIDQWKQEKEFNKRLERQQKEAEAEPSIPAELFFNL